MGDGFTILAVVQGGRLEAEALLFMASLRASGNAQPVVLAETQPGPLWPGDPRISRPELRSMLNELGAEIRPLHSRHFGSDYPQGNKIEALRLLDEGPFVFFDTDTLFLAPLETIPFNFERPSASLRREATWPKPFPGWPGFAAVWKSLYDRFGLDCAASLDPGRAVDDWQRYLYFNAGWFFHRSAQQFGTLFNEYALSVRDNPPPELAGQKLTPWLDQIVLPLVIHALNGGRATLPPGLLDGAVTCHYRTLPLLYARESDAAVAMLEKIAEASPCRDVLAGYEPLRRMVYERQGGRVRAMFASRNGSEDEAFFRKRLKAGGLWLR